MSNVVPFIPKSELAAKVALNQYVSWAKSQIRLYDQPSDPIQWEAKSWHRWGLKNTVCSRLGKNSEALHPDFIDYCKAKLFDERAVKLSEDGGSLNGLRCLEVALLEITKNGDVRAVTAAVFDRACALAQDHYNSSKVAYGISRKLKQIYDHLHLIGAVINPFIWEPQIKDPRLTLEKSAEAARKRLPSEEALIALGEIFHSKPGLHLDIMTTSTVAILLSQPSRIGEMIYLKKDCFHTEIDTQGREQLYILWYSEKGFGANLKPIPDSMAEICKEAVSRVIEISQEAREYAKWLEDNPETFPIHAGVPDKALDAPLSFEEACNALLVPMRSHQPRNAYKHFLISKIKSRSNTVRACRTAQELFDDLDASRGVRRYVNGKVVGCDYNDKGKITLRKLNSLVREAYLPRSFPYTDSKRITKFQDALFCFKTGAFTSDDCLGKKRPFGLTIGCHGGRLGVLLSGTQRATKSIFQRYGYADVRVNSHAFRHYLNTGAQRTGLSQELIARWSGRVDVSQNRVYNHLSTEEKVTEVEVFTPGLETSRAKLLNSLKTKTPISMRDLGEESDRIVHRTEFGVCIHDYAQEPCAKFNNCLTCGEHVCVKGDDTKLGNLKDEHKYLRRSLVAFQKEADEGSYGANTWLKTTMEKMERCEQLIEMLENQDIADGALIKGVENGWTIGRNAIAMRGELTSKNDNLIATDTSSDKVAELEQLLNFKG